MSDPSAITSSGTPSVTAATEAVQHSRPTNITTFDTSPSTSSSAPIQTSTTTTTTSTTAPAPAPGPGTGKAKRSKHGCRTCRRRRKKCDETRPTCLGCRKLGIECEGYERPLIWGNGIASRGKLKGATVPTIEMWAPSKAGRKGSEAGKKTSPEVRRGKVGEKSAGEEFPAHQVPGLDRRESTQSMYSDASVLQSQPAPQQPQQQQQQPLPDFTIQEVKRIPFRPTASTMAAGMSTFAVAPAGAPAPAPAPQTSTPIQEPLATPVVEPASTPKSMSELTDKSSPNFDIVDIFNNCEEPLDQELYDRLILEFFTSGHLTLYSADKNDSPILSTVFPLARTSLTLRSVCASYQALLSEVPISQFQAIYSRALQQYRADLNDKTVRAQDCTICAGILLCSIGASQNLPFTFHIQPVLKLLTMRTDLDLMYRPFHAHAVEVMGYYDLPSFIINRKGPRLDIWQNYCRRQGTDREGIEPVSGLPRSLLDIFADLEEGDCEERFWYWYGREGTVLQVHLWDAHRYAGMLKHREIKNDYRKRMKESGLDHSIPDASKPHLPPSRTIINRLVASIAVIFRCYDFTDSGEPHLILNSSIYPLFIAGCQLLTLDPPNTEWEETIDDIFSLCENLGLMKMQVVPLRRILGVMKRNPELSPDQVAANMGMEIALV